MIRKLSTCVSLMVAMNGPTFAQSDAPNLTRFHGQLMVPLGQLITRATEVRVRTIQGGTAVDVTTGRVVFEEKAIVEPDEAGISTT